MRMGKNKVVLKILSMLLICMLFVQNVSAEINDDNTFKFDTFKIKEVDEKIASGDGTLFSTTEIKSVEAYIWRKSDTLAYTENIQVPFHETEKKNEYHLSWNINLQNHEFAYGEYEIKFVVITENGEQLFSTKSVNLEKTEKNEIDQTEMTGKNDKDTVVPSSMKEKDDVKKVEETVNATPKRDDENIILKQKAEKANSNIPVISDMRVVRTSGSTYTIEATVTDTNGIAKVLVPTWTLKNGQDDLVWGEAAVVGDKATYTVDMKDHKYETGDYATQFVARNTSGGETIATVIQNQAVKVPVIKNVKVTAGTGSYTVEGEVDAAYGISKVMFPTWTLKNGQDDLIWGTGTINGNKISYTVYTRDHNYEDGTYVTQIIAYDKTGSSSAISQVTPTINKSTPSISNMRVVRTSGSTYTIEATVTDANGIAKVLVPTWTLKNGQDDLVWGEAAVVGDKATYTVDMKDHKYETGDYATQFVARNTSGGETIATVIQNQAVKVPVIKNVKVTAGTGSYTVEGEVDAAYGISKVMFPTWTLKNGQDDLIWGTGTINGNKISYTVYTRDHNYEDGTYVTQIIAYDKTGSSSAISQVTPTINKSTPSISNMRVVRTSGSTYTIEATVTDANGIAKVLVPTWTLKNGQDDLVWGEAAVVGDKATYTVDMKDHKYETGDYATQFVARNTSGGETIATVIQNQAVKVPVIKNVKVTAGTGSYTVEGEVDAAYGISKVMFPTWTLKNGQDDLIWGTGTINGNKISYTVYTKDHYYEEGSYITQIIVYDKTGNSGMGQVIQDLKNSTAIQGWKIINGQKYLFNKNGEMVKGANKMVVDISEHNGTIDWVKAKAAGVDGVILRAGYGWNDNLEAQRDKTFNKNADELERLGIPYGVYLYSYEKSAAGAIKEAQYTLNLIKGRKISLPVYYDLEYDDYVGNLSQATYVAMAKAYCEKIRDAGYTPGIYANLNYWNTKLNDSSLDKYNKWVAQYNTNDGLAGHCDYTKPYKVWQYTSVGKVDGIKTNVDMNAWYGDF